MVLNTILRTVFQIEKKRTLSNMTYTVVNIAYTIKQYRTKLHVSIVRVVTMVSDSQTFLLKIRFRTGNLKNAVAVMAAMFSPITPS